MIRALFPILLMISPNAMACRETTESYWLKPELFLAKESKWVSVVKIEEIDSKLRKSTYSFSIVKNLKGQGPSKLEMKIGPFPTGSQNESRGRTIWRDKGCTRYVFLEKGKEYILFSTMDNPDGIQPQSPDNEARIQKEIESLGSGKATDGK